MQPNPWWVPLLVYGVPLVVGTGWAGYAISRSVSEGERERLEQQRQQAIRQEEQARVAQLQTQMMIEQMRPWMWASVPAMVLIGAYLLHKSKQEEVEEL
jgi:uncharacterized membrane protein (DUF106 family)